MDVDILDSIPDPNEYKSFTDRYFSKRYILNFDGILNNDLMLMFHSNRIALVSLAPSHFFFKNNQDYMISFKVGNVDRLTNVVKGKGKKGGQKLYPNSALCKVFYEDGKSFTIRTGMKATLIEINEELVKNPKLLRESPDSIGFVAIILAKIEISDATKNELFTHEEYVKQISKNQN